MPNPTRGPPDDDAVNTTTMWRTPPEQVEHNERAEDPLTPLPSNDGEENTAGELVFGVELREDGVFTGDTLYPCGAFLPNRFSCPY